MDSVAIPGLLIWVFSIIIGCVIGVQKDQEASGLIWSFLFGPLGVIVVLCLPNKKAEAAKKLELQQQQNFQTQQLELQRQQIEQLQQLHAMQFSKSIEVEPLSVATEPVLRIAKNGQEIGEFTFERVNAMLDEGELSSADYFFSDEENDWITLDRLLPE